MRHVPNALTFLRLAIIPFVVLALLSGWTGGRWFALALFGAAAVTDFLDGFLARRWGQVSSFGAMLDPIADKVLVACILLVLTAEQTISGWHLMPALVILSREVFVSGLREYLAALSVTVPVTLAARVKTAAQFAAVALLIVAPALSASRSWVFGLGFGFLWIAALLTAYTGWAYFHAGLRHIAVDGKGSK
jgi:cardiolipin synthase